ncbi:metal ABC transporter solute-binding protein, Zn/Mn family [Massilibacterium senegalense]|uniref:metal ABC transporter solute-binding protein, Zn/Mn family n=1 Tax=Massilibacterium senegalense TaxID=1632858 RepID=UPI000783A967|nr:zinc ABC transporter substrate-binding protein [Massilibacterium senegalense]
MNKKILMAMMAFVISFIGLIGCTNEESAKNKKETLIVTATTSQVADAVKNIGGEYVTVVSLMGPGVDPHLYKATQSDIKKLQEADIIFYNGLHLEGKMTDVLAKMDKEKPTYAIAEQIDKSLLKEDKEDVRIVDPHVWFDIDLWTEAVKQVEEGLIGLDPDHKEQYQKNAKQYYEELAALKEYAKERLETIPKEQRVLVTAHDAFGYFGDAYDMEVMGLQGLSTDAEYGIKDVQKLVDVLVNRQVKAVFIESSISEKSIQAVIEGAKKKNHNVVIGGELFSDAMGEERTEEGTYVGMYKHNVDTIVQSLK